MSDRSLFLIFDDDRPSDSPLVERVWRSHSERAGTFHSMAASNWMMVVTRLAAKTFLTVRGPETRATSADCPADGQWIGVHFKLGTFMPLLPTGMLRDRNDVTLPEASSRSFWLNGSAWEYPNFDNVETFVTRLVKHGLGELRRQGIQRIDLALAVHKHQLVAPRGNEQIISQRPRIAKVSPAWSAIKAASRSRTRAS